MTRINNRSKEFIIKHRDILVCLILVMVTLAVYWRVQNYDFINFDDNVNITENIHLKAGMTIDNIIWSFTEATQITNYWVPLTWLSFILDFELYGMNPGGYHVTNVLFHIASVLLLFVVLRKMTGSLWRSGFVAVLFALHPTHVESVAWISERKDVLSAFFWILTMWSYVWYVNRPRSSRYLTVLLVFFMGLMAKPMLVTLPFVLLLLDYWPLCRFQFGQLGSESNSQQLSAVFRLVLEKLPFFIIIAIISVVTFLTQKEGGVMAPFDFLPVRIRIANTLVFYISYIGKMILPINLAVLYPYPMMQSLWKVTAAGLFLVVISLLAYRTNRQHPYFIVGWLWYIGTLIPVIGFVLIGPHGMADRYTYIPFIGLFIVIVWGVPELVAQWRHRKIWLATLATVVLTILMAMTLKQVAYWENSITLFEHTLKITSKNYVAHFNLGAALYNQGRTEEAIEHYLQALRIKPDYVNAHNNLGVALYNQDRTEEAIEHYLQALRIKPDYEKAHNNLGNALFNQGLTEEAIEHYLQALRIKPDYVDAHYNLGVALFNQGRTEEAIEHYLQVLRIKPDYEKAHNNLGIVLFRTGNIEGAIAHFREALRINPDLSHTKNNLNKLLMMQQQNK